MKDIPVLINYNTGTTEPEHAPVRKGQGDQIVWRSNNPNLGFDIKIEKLSTCTCPPTPFASEKFSARPGQTVSSGPVKDNEAVGHVYKANIKFTDGKVIDPHIIVDK